jgi:mannose-6-phosphate isomerase
MSAIRLTTRRVAKPWGRRDLLPAFGDVAPDEEPVGEIWFEDERGGDPELLVKYLFTSEKLSIQVHPDDAAARARGHVRGKEEAWLILAAEADATIGIGLRERTDPDVLRVAAADGRIEAMVDWRPARVGDYYYSPAGTVHALGPGLKLIEIQQNVDLTYRLYDYGRPRDLHIEAGVAAANPAPYEAPFEPYRLDPVRLILAEGRKFVLERWRGPVSGRLEPGAAGLWLVPVAGAGVVDGQAMTDGSVWRVEGPVQMDLGEGVDLLLAYPEAQVRADLLSVRSA